MRVDFNPEGIYLPELYLWLDPREPRAAAWMSHGHSDHASGLHRTVLATPETLRICRSRFAEMAGSAELVVLPYNEPVSFRDARLTALPAGHIVGAAQLLVEHDGERLVYTGDIKLRPPLCGTAATIVPCDHLIIESTFGLPIYHFISREEARRRIVAFARECLAEEETPAFLGYALGRGQEIAHVLCQGGVATAVHGSIARFIPAYEESGYRFPGWIPYDARPADGCAWVVVPGFQNILTARGDRVRLAFVSGWAALHNTRARVGAEELIPYSDHADFEELLELVDGTGAKRVDVVHGYAEPFAHVLRGRGIDARAPLPAVAPPSAEEQEG